MITGIALSGGGARGIAHIGVLKALEEKGIHIHRLAGTSAGSIVAALYAYGYAPDRVFEIIKSLSIFKSVRPAWTWTGLLKMDGLQELLHKYIPENSFEALKLPLTVAATEIRKGQIHYFSEGELIPAIIASCSIPAIFEPRQFQGGLYVDGGIFDNLPARPIRDLCDVVIGSHCNHISTDFDAKSLKVVIERSMLMTINANTQISRKLCDVFIEPPHLDRFGSFDIGKAQEIYDTGYQFAKSNFMPHDFQHPTVAR